MKFDKIDNEPLILVNNDYSPLPKKLYYSTLSYNENLPIEIADILREAGYEAETVWSEQIQGLSDIKLLEICRDEKRVLVNLNFKLAL